MQLHIQLACHYPSILTQQGKGVLTTKHPLGKGTKLKSKVTLHFRGVAFLHTQELQAKLWARNIARDVGQNLAYRGYAGNVLGDPN